MIRYCLFPLLLAVVVIPGLASAQDSSYFQTLASQVQIAKPPGWRLASDSIEFPFQFVHDQPLAELLIFRSYIESKDLIRNRDDLKSSVDVVINDVILSLPDAELITSSGFYNGYRAGFVIEFRSTDSLAGSTLKHRFCGLIYRRPDGDQVLFTLWAKALESQYSLVEPEIRLMQDSFRYNLAYEDDVFSGEPIPYFRLAALLVLLVVLFYLVRRRRMKAAAEQHYSDNRYWRCQCGRVNRTTVSACRQCGRQAPQPETDDGDVIDT